jgi:hypothetical protein
MSWPFSDSAKAVRRALYRQFVSQGQSENIEHLMAETALSRSQVQVAMLELERGAMLMLLPHTYDVAKCPPWSNLPTDHRVECDGAYLGYAGCSIEAINMSYCYPGLPITIRTCCAHSGDPITMVWRDGAMLACAPTDGLLYVGTDPRGWGQDWFGACANNVFFSSSGAKDGWESEHGGVAGLAVDFARLTALATYTTTRRFDFERGADGDPALLLTMLAGVGLPLPASWQAGGAAIAEPDRMVVRGESPSNGAPKRDGE